MMRSWAAFSTLTIWALLMGISGESLLLAQSRKAVCYPATFRTVIDVGHTDKVYGATSARGAREYDFNLRLAREIAQALIDAGYRETALFVTNESPQAGLYRRSKFANELPADLFISVHHDSVPDKFLKKWEYEGVQRVYSDEFKGHVIFISKYNGDLRGSRLFGRMLGLEMKKRGLTYTPHYTRSDLGNRHRELDDGEAGVYWFDNLVVLMSTKMPAVLLEAGSIINRDEEQQMNTPQRRALIRDSVLFAVENFCQARGSKAPQKR